jgi:hypothetical protein
LLVHRFAHRTIEGARAPFDSFALVPRHWIWIQAMIMLFLIASIVIAITRLV